METELASLALLSKGTFATVEGVTNGFVLWRHLVAACGQCLLLWILVELIADFAKTFAFGLQLWRPSPLESNKTAPRGDSCAR